MVIYRLYRDDELPSRVRLVLYVVAISCVVGKMCLALVVMFPLEEDVGDRGGMVKGGAVAGLEVTAVKEAKIECGIAPSKGGQLEAASGRHGRG